MWRVIYRPSSSIRRSRPIDLTLTVLRELRTSFHEYVGNADSTRLNHLRPCKACGKLYTGNRLVEGLCEECITKHRPEKLASRTRPCKSCGIRFSPNLMKDDLCGNCSDRATECEGSGYRADAMGARVPLDRELLQAYEILGCDENSSDDIIKNRYRELVKGCHSDGLGLGIPLGEIRKANKKFCDVHKAYETIVRSRRKRS